MKDGGEKKIKIKEGEKGGRVEGWPLRACVFPQKPIFLRLRVFCDHSVVSLTRCVCLCALGKVVQAIFSVLLLPYFSRGSRKRHGVN